MIKRWIRRILIGLVVLFVGIQVVPYGRNRENPSVRAEPKWDSPRTRELAVRLCYDCHSNETIWPWYSYIAPISWWIQRDVRKARDELNFSEWDRPQKEAKESGESVEEGSMPPPCIGDSAGRPN
ncbi:MAG TPA: heme-binding domain-containing protein [Nitrospinota bacterium]|nr:heme-binding domain-containing protein [Nitrospinota bacterium]